MREFDFKSIVNYRNDNSGPVSGGNRRQSQREIGKEIIEGGRFNIENGDLTLVISPENARKINPEDLIDQKNRGGTQSS